MRSLDEDIDKAASSSSIIESDQDHEDQYGGREARVQIMEFISKINQTVLRARVANLYTNSEGSVFDKSSLIDRMDFWRSRTPINVDIFVAATRRLMERWVLSFEYHISSKTSNDLTDLILLAQSLYSYVRLLPLQSAVTDGNLQRSAINYCVSTTDGSILASSEDYGDETGSSGFDLSAKLKVYKFRSATTSAGKLHLSLVYDANLANFMNFSSPSPRSTRVSREDAVAPQATASVQHQRPSPSERGSPFPSPTFTRKVVALAQLKHEKSSLIKAPCMPSTIPTQNTRNVAGSIITLADSPNSRAVPIPVPIVSPSKRRSTSPDDSNLDADGVDRGCDTTIDDTQHPESDPNAHLESPNMSNSANDGSYQSHRRLSSGGELFGSLVGSYEESILSGRMSTLPSKPIMFVAQIGVVAFGKCKPYLQCPPHINVEFPAYFYEMFGDSAVITPYVGSIDLDPGKPVLGEGSERNRKTSGYRLPPRGQLQILIKNPSKTTVKVFLVPYDLRDMPPSTKTFLRQKSYTISSNLSPIETTTSSNLFSKMSPASKSPESATVNSQLPPRIPSTSGSHMGCIPTNSLDKNRLRYVIQVQIISTPRKRFFLSKSIRVVFSPRQPESGEKLKVVCEGPENPKYLPLDSVTPISESRKRIGNNLSQLIAAGVNSDFSVSPVRSSPLMMPHSSHHHLLYTQSAVEEDLHQNRRTPNNNTDAKSTASSLLSDRSSVV